MQDFIDYLNDNFSDSIETLAKTSEGNRLFEFDFQMIDLDRLAKRLEKIDMKFRGNEFATADALFISNVDDELIFHFIEFKNVDYDDDKNLKMSKYWLEECLSKMDECEHECFIKDKSTDVYKSKFHKISPIFTTGFSAPCPVLWGIYSACFSSF